MALVCISVTLCFSHSMTSVYLRRREPTLLAFQLIQYWTDFEVTSLRQLEELFEIPNMRLCAHVKSLYRHTISYPKPLGPDMFRKLEFFGFRNGSHRD
jgi:hypothetical protein